MPTTNSAPAMVALWDWRRIPLAGPLLVAYGIFGALFVPHFLSAINVTSILFSVAALLPAVLGMQLLLVLGRFDLSLGANASLAGMVAGLFMTRYQSIPLALGSALVVSAITGFIGGLLVSRFRVDPLIATIALLGVLRSLSLVANDGRIVAGLPGTFGSVADARVAEVPLLILLALALVAAASVLTRHLVTFRRIYAAGNNPVAASHAGVDVGSLVMLGYVLAGLGAALTGLIQASRTLSASPLLFDTLAIEAITACVIGGGSLVGGKGGMVGASIGLLVVATTNNLVVMVGISVYWQSFAVGILLLLAVLGTPVGTEVRNRIFTLFHRRQA